VISGVADVAFQRARDAFVENFEHHSELGGLPLHSRIQPTSWNPASRIRADGGPPRSPRATRTRTPGRSLGFADPDIGLGFGYTPNQTIASMAGGDPRWTPLIDAVYECVS